MTTALIDADVLTYVCGFSGDKTNYYVGKKKFKYHKDAKAWCKDQGLDFKEAIVKEHLPGNFDSIKKSIDFLIDDICDQTEADSYKLYLTGSGNFRDTIAVTHPYKGNRDKAKRPHHYSNIRDYLVDGWNAEIINDMEADDALGIEQCTSEEETVICSIDKDLLMIPGWHYNFNKKEFTTVKEHESWFNFYVQLLMGDRTDNIFCIEGIGPVTAKKILSPWGCPEGMLCAVGKEYVKHFDDPEARMLENANLLYIKRDMDDAWNFTKHIRSNTNEH